MPLHVIPSERRHAVRQEDEASALSPYQSILPASQDDVVRWQSGVSPLLIYYVISNITINYIEFGQSSLHLSAHVLLAELRSKSGLTCRPNLRLTGGEGSTDRRHKTLRVGTKDCLVTLVLPQTLCLPMVCYLPTLLYLSLPYCSLVPTIHPRCRCAVRPSNNVLESLRSPISPA